MNIISRIGAALLALAAFGASAQTTYPITTENLTPTAACTAGSCVAVDMTSKGGASVQVTGTYTTVGGLALQRTVDGTTWETITANAFVPVGGTGIATIASGDVGTWQLGACVGFKLCRITALGAVTGTAAVTVFTSTASTGGSLSISGGAGDASAANQVTMITSLSVLDDWDETNRAAVNVVAGQVGITAGAGAVAANTPRVTHASDDPVTAHVSRLTSSAGPKAAGAALATTALQVGGTYNATPITVADTQEAGAQIDANGYLKVNVAAGGASGGTSSSVGAATPATATAAGGSDGTNMQVPRVADIDTGAGTQYALVTSPRLGASGGGVELVGGAGAVAAGVLRTTQASDSPLVSVAGATGDAAATAGGTGSVSAKLRLMTTQLDTLNTSVNATTTQLPADGTGQVAMTASFPVVLASDHSNIPANVAQINGVTPLMGAGNTGTGSQRVTMATDQAAIATAGHGATGAAVPANVTAMGARAGANSVNVAQGSATVAINVSTATTTELVALSGSTQVRVTGIVVIAGGTGNITFVYGTGTACGTGTTSLSGAIPLIANAGLTIGGGLGSVLVAPAGQALCVTTSAAVQMSGFVTYTQF